MLDGRIASDYYSTVDAGSYIVNPLDGKRFDNGTVFGWIKGTQYCASATVTQWVDIISPTGTTNETYYTNWSNNSFGGWYVHNYRVYYHCFGCAVPNLYHIGVCGWKPAKGWASTVIKCPINSSGARINVGFCNM